MTGKADVGQYYDVKSETYDDVFKTLYYRIHDIITWKYIEPYLPINPEAVVLDAAGGTGRWSLKMARKGCKVILIDISKRMLNIAKKKTTEENLQDRITIKRGDISKIDFADKTFDFILCEHSLFLFEKPAKIIQELGRVLKRGSRLIISVHNRYAQSLASLSDEPTTSNIEKSIELLSRKKYTTMTKEGKVKVYTWTPNEFQELLESNGFQVEKIIGKGVTMPLRVSQELFMKTEYPEELFTKLLEFELIVCENKDALALAGILQAITRKP